MTDRDHFAAAALTGLLASREWPIDSDEAAHYCYRVADAMLRERERTNHDAAPAARASLPTADHAVCRGRGSGCGTGDTQEPVAWAVVYPDDEVAVVAFKRRDADERATASDRIVPLYRSPTLTDAERGALEFAVAHGETVDAAWRYALRGLLERLGGVR